MTTCCERHKINCNQGRQCPLRRCVVYDVRVVRPGHEPLEYETHASSSVEAINGALDRYGLEARVSAKRAFG